MRNAISKLYKTVAAPATRDSLTERLQSVRDTSSLLYNRMIENMGYGQQKRLKDIVEKERAQEDKPAADKEEEQEAKEQQQDDNELYDTAVKIKLVYKGK